MKRYFLLLLIFCGIFFSTFSQENSDSAKAKQDAKRWSQLQKNLNEKFAGEMMNVIFQRLELQINPAESELRGNVTTHFLPKEKNIKEISFDFNVAMTVDSVISHKKRLNFQHSLNILKITLSDSVYLSQKDSVQVFYHGIPKSNGFGSYVRDLHNNVPIIWTLSEPFGAKDWWPCKQALNDKIDSIEIFVIHPTEYKAASNGILISETFRDNKKITHWKHRHPIAAYLVAVAVTNYQVYTDTISLSSGEKFPMINYVYPETLDEAKRNTPKLANAMKLFSDLFIPYPFKNEKYGHAQFGWGGGMEHQTMTFIVYFDYSLMAHELAHQWFGDYLTCSSFKDIWLNEGFATYLEGLTCEHGFGDESWQSWKESRIRSITAAPNGSVYVKDTTSEWSIFNSRLSYSKGAMILNMLRWEMGDSAFFKTLRNYISDPKLANHYASTSDFQRHAEAVSKKNLTEFFDNWIYKEGFPVYKIETKQNEQNIVTLKMEQTPSHSSVNFFKLHVPIKFVGEGKDTLIVFEHQYSGQEFIFQLSFKLKETILDPNCQLITANPIITLIKNDDESKKWELSPNPVSSVLTLKTNKSVRLENVKIYSLSGNLVKNISVSSKESQFNIDVTELQTGTYFIRIESKAKVWVRKFIKQ